MSTTYRLGLQFGLATLLSGIVATAVLIVCDGLGEPPHEQPRPQLPVANLPGTLLFCFTAILMLMTVIVLVSALIETLLRRIDRKTKCNNSVSHSE